MEKPKPTTGLHHLALFVVNFEECEKFYTELMGMRVDWRPDADNLYLTTGSDNFAMHRAPQDFEAAKHQRLDHFGFFLDERAEVDKWHAYLVSKGVKAGAPKDHRDGTRSFYCADPDGNSVQIIYYPVTDR